MHPLPRLESEVFAEVVAAGDGVVGEVFGGAFEDDAAFEEEVCAVDDLEGFADVVVGDEEGEAILIAQVGDDFLDVQNGDGVDATEGFVEHEEGGLGAEGSGDGEASFLAS